MEVIINYLRPGKGTARYIEGLVDSDATRIKTLSMVPGDFGRKWCEEVWWQNGCVAHGVVVGSVMKFLFYKEWFTVMQLIGINGDNLGYYLDIATPLRKVDGEFQLTDLFLDLWVWPDGKFMELDRDEFEEGFRMGLLTPYQYKKANQIFNKLKRLIMALKFVQLLD